MKRLLLVDSDMTVQQWAESNFQNEGLEVTSYGDGLSALDMLSNTDPDVILAEYQLAGMNIFRFCDKLRQKEGDKKRPLFILCDSEDAVDRERLNAAGVAGYIQKPMNLTEVLGKIRGLNEKPVAVSGQSPEAPAAPSAPAEDAEALKMEELLGWKSSEEKAATGSSPARAAEPLPDPGGISFEEDDRTVVAGADLEQSVVKSWEGTGVLPEEDATVVASGVPPASIPFGTSPLDPEEPSAPIEPPDSRLISGSMAELAQVAVRPAGVEGLMKGASSPEGIEATVSQAAREIVEKVAWEVVPALAEAMIKAELEKLKSEKPE